MLLNKMFDTTELISLNWTGPRTKLAAAETAGIPIGRDLRNGLIYIRIQGKVKLVL